MEYRFSTRTAWDTGESGLAKAIREARAAGKPLVDLTISNPTVCGFEYDMEMILGALLDAAAMRYDPNPRGLRTARIAVSEYYREHSAEVNADDVVLTTSTSEAYSFIFRLLCDAGDSVLVAQPSYPLFDFIAGLDDVQLGSYPLFYDYGWHIDFAELELRIGPRTRAIVLVHPNNPTGHATSEIEVARLLDICAKRGLGLIVDEVFLDYGLTKKIESVARLRPPCLMFVVSGLSKVAALPQMKVGWIVCLGPERLRREALSRLEIVADTFLSMNAPVQHALPTWLGGGGAIQRQIVARVRENLLATKGLQTIQLLPADAGWNAVVRLPQILTEDELGTVLVQEAGVVVHPGSYYGLPGERFVVISTIGLVESFKLGISQLDAWCESRKLM